MVATPRPEPGGPIESLWGGQVHDVAVLSRGVIASGAPQAAGGVVRVPIDTVLSGDPTMVDLAANCLVAPADGLYEIAWSLIGTGYTGGAYRCNQYIEASPSNIFTGWGHGWPGVSSGMRSSFYSIVPLLAGQKVYLEVPSGSGGSGTQSIGADRIAFRLVAQELG